MSEIRGEGSGSPEELIAEALEKNDMETSVAKIVDSRSIRMLRDALEQAEQSFRETDRRSGVAIVQTLKQVIDDDATLVVEGEKVSEIRKGDESGE